MNLLKYISFRAGLSILMSLAIAMIYGKRIINFFTQKANGELVRDLGLEDRNKKKGLPTMGGLIIILATIVPVLLFTRVWNVYIVLLIVSMVWMGAIGFLDDYLKKVKKNKDGLRGIFKVIGQVGLGLIVVLLCISTQILLFSVNMPMHHQRTDRISRKTLRHQKRQLYLQCHLRKQ